MAKKVDKEAEVQDNETAEKNKQVNKEQNAENNKSKNKDSKNLNNKKTKQSKDQPKKTKAAKDPVNKEIDDLSSKLLAAEEKSNEYHDKYMRLSAEFDNYRKRTLKEKTDLTKLANANLLTDIIPVIDDFERGIENIDKAENVEALKEGVHLIYNKFSEFVGQNGIKEIEAIEKEFDIDFHEALTKIPAPSEELKGKVIDVIEKGYLLNDKVLRYAKVVIGE
jgi:molecular chaperone GrpE